MFRTTTVYNVFTQFSSYTVANHLYSTGPTLFLTTKNRLFASLSDMKSKPFHFVALLVVMGNLIHGCATNFDCSPSCNCESRPSLNRGPSCIKVSSYNNYRDKCETCSVSSSCTCTAESRRPVCESCDANAFDTAKDKCSQPFSGTKASQASMTNDSSSSSEPVENEASISPIENKYYGGDYGGVYLDGGTLAGIIVGCIVGVALIICVVIFGIRKWRSRNRVF